MTWFTSSTNETESQREHVQLFLAVDFDFTSGHARAWSGGGDITINGQTYTGVGTLGSISQPSDSVGLTYNRKSYRLSLVTPSVVSEADIEACFGRSVTEYLGFINPTTGAIVDTPEINWEGRMDSVSRVDGPSPYVEVNAEHILAILDQSDDWRYTHEHQKQFYPSGGDDGFTLVKSIQLKEVIWGSQIARIGAAINRIVGRGLLRP